MTPRRPEGAVTVDTETSYGMVKRLAFAAGVIAEREARQVLDIGCGTGNYLTTPLAGRLPDVSFVGIDSDAASIEWARANNHLPNLTFETDIDALRDRCFDLVIASEVLEHVEHPVEFLQALRARLAPGGVLLVTVPNGYGPFEWASLTETLLRLSGLFDILRTAVRLVKGKRPLRMAEAAGGAQETLAHSPHINFFTYGAVRQVFGRAGFTVRHTGARTAFCGFGFDQLIHSFRLVDWNARVADRLSPKLVSDWMFVLEPGDATNGAGKSDGFSRTAFQRWRRRLNERRLGLHLSQHQAE